MMTNRLGMGLLAGILMVSLGTWADNLPGAKRPRMDLYGPESVLVQCPPDTDGIDTDGDGIVDNDNVCMHLTSGDGFVKTADRDRTGAIPEKGDIYTFGFSDVTLSDVPALDGVCGAEFPAPTLVGYVGGAGTPQPLREGQKLYLTLTNVGMVMRGDLFDPHTVHFHGFPNASTIFDGEPMAGISINMGASLTYFYNLVEPGTYMYHCHVEASEHMQMGMLGNLYVLPKQDRLPNGTDLRGFTHVSGYKYAYNDGDGSTFYDVDFPIQVTSFDPKFHDADLSIQPLDFAYMKDTYPMLNGRGYPDTVLNAPIMNNRKAYRPELLNKPAQKVNAIIQAGVNQKLLLRISSLATTEFYSVKIMGLSMKVIGRGARLLRGPDGPGGAPGKNLYYDTDTITLGGGQSAEVILDLAGVTPGTYYLYSSNLNHLSNNTEDYGGMMTEIVVTP